MPLAAAVLLLVFCCWRVVSMGIVLLPTSTSNEAMITLSTTDTLSKDESYDVAGKVVQAVMAVDGVEEVGITPDNTVAGMDVSNLGLPSTITDLLNAANGYGKYKINVKLNEELPLPRSTPPARPWRKPWPALRTAPPPSSSTA